MAKHQAKTTPTPFPWAVSALLVVAFVSSGSFIITTLPPVPLSKALNLIAAGLWCAAFAFGLARWSKLDRRVLWGLAAVLGSVALSWALGGSWLAVLVYDLFADMPLVQWFAMLAVFVLAAGLHAEERAVARGLDVVLGIGALLSLVLAYQTRTMGGSGVFGSTAYSITALVPLVPIGAVLAHRATGGARIARYAASAVVVLSLALFSRSTMGLLGAGFAVLVTLAVHPAFASASTTFVRRGAAVLAALAFAGLLVAQVPALSGSVVTPERLASFDRNIVTRAYLWDGAEKMLAARPLAGFGPSGYRLHAAEYLAPEALQFGPDLAGNIDPTVYSPQSPHSVFWEIATRLGVLGLLAFGFLLWAWGSRVREAAGGAKGDLSLALGAGFVSALFVLLVTPVVFPIGLFGAAVAGLAVGPEEAGAQGAAGRWAGARPYAVFGAVAFVVLGVWLGSGEWKAYNAPTDNGYATVDAYASVLRQLPGNPAIERRWLETRLLTAADAHTVADVQAEVDAAPAAIAEFAPNLVSLATYSLAQAENTGRTDVAWEVEQLDRAARVLPPIPSLVSERLHAAVIAGDAQAAAAALPDAKRWGGPYPYAADYIARAEALAK